MTLDALPCRICNTPASFAGVKQGAVRSLNYQLYRCPHCNFGFVGNPSTDYEQIYTLDYYSGNGADPLVDYVNELHNPQGALRQYEWRGITSVVSRLKPITEQTRWLDFGCGNGGLVRWVKERYSCNIQGFEEGEIADLARTFNISILRLDELNRESNCYDIITAIEVLEHVDDPIGVLQRIFALLKPGGIFFYTTGNATRWRDRLTDWGYVIPEIHISFYEPETLSYGMSKVGFQVKHLQYSNGFNDIIRFKVLKNLQCQHPNLWEKLLPWFILSPLVDRIYGVSAFPIGIKV